MPMIASIASRFLVLVTVVHPQKVVAEGSEQPPAGSVGTFDFGANWHNYLDEILRDDDQLNTRLVITRNQLRHDFGLHGEHAFRGRSFLDIGCGSGIHSLAAYTLGASVFSIDALNGSVDSTVFLRGKMLVPPSRTESTRSSECQGECLSNQSWHIQQGSILEPYAWSKGERFDLVYAWGSLHHTGSTWHALKNTIQLVKPAGRLFLALYAHELYSDHDEWLKLKKQYVEASPRHKKMISYAFLYASLREKIEPALAEEMQNIPALNRTDYSHFHVVLRIVEALVNNHTLSRGMDLFTDAEDWIGGYPMEWVETVDICQLLHAKGRFVMQGGPQLVNGMLTVLAGPKEDADASVPMTGPFLEDGDGCYYRRMPEDLPSGRESQLRIFEDGACLGAPNGKTHEDALFCSKPGRYFHEKGFVMFTASDGSNPNTNGRSYSLWVPSDY
ncbi:unnamed protein product [Polarella glacialis]|uniref:Methyltransferase domain-containing protein n=1 Tax=Polarella glacialis TaxID=89957 RepID=A0A813F874_POLGL|nr:unnamed protein product [Polarella glacialis]